MKNTNPDEMKPGYLFNAPYELFEPVRDGQQWYNEDKKLITLSNPEGRLWWAKSIWCPHNQMLLVCTDQLLPLPPRYRTKSLMCSIGSLDGSPKTT